MERSTSLNHNDNSLESDMGLVVRRMRQRQQDHRRFYEHNDKINSRWSELVDQIYIHDEISKLRIYLDDRLSTEKSQLDLDAQLSNRYQHIFTCADPVVLLMKKVVAKVVDIAQASIDSFKQPIQYYSVGFKRFKTTCLRASSDAISCRPANIIKIFSRFFHSKVIVEVERLRYMIQCLQQSDSKGLQGLKDAYYCKLTLKELATPKKEVISSKELRSDSTSILSIKIIKKEVKPMQSEKQIRIKVSKHEEKHKQKLRKLQIKRLKRYVQSICEVMDVNRQQLLEDMFIDFKQSQSRRILTQLTSRNKHNFTQIQMFVDNTKDAIIDTSLLEVHTVSNIKEKLVEESSSERVIPQSTPQVIQVSPSKNQRGATLRYLRRDSLNIKPRNIYKQRKTVNNMNEVPIAEVSEPQKKGGDFAQLNIKDQSSKQRFPQIYARATSVDIEKAQKKDIHLKILKNQKINKEQLQLGRGGQSSNQTFTSKKHNADIETNSKQMKGREKIESKIKLQLKTGTNFFEEIGKKISKFCEMKKNLKV